jgi:hypothetical protein
MIDVRVETPAVHAVIPIKRISGVDATESIPPVKSAEAVECDPAAAEVETSETSEMDATKSVEPTEVEAAEVEAAEMASSEVTATKVATAEVTTAEVATTETAGICDLRQSNHGRNERCGDERNQFTIHDTLLLDGDLLAVTEALRKCRS